MARNNSYANFRSAAVAERVNIKYYHYTKGYRLAEIILSGEIIARGGAVKLMEGDRFVWLTRDEEFPVTAYPAIPAMPESLLSRQLVRRQDVDLMQMASHVGGLWRFVFSKSSHPRITSWLGSLHRKRMMKTREGFALENVATRLRERVEHWAVVTESLAIANSTLQQLTPQGWVDRLGFVISEGELGMVEFGQANSNNIIRDSCVVRERISEESRRQYQDAA